MRTGDTIQVDDPTTDNRWRKCRPHGLSRGIVSSLPIPPAIDGQTVAAMNLYATGCAAFDEAACQHAKIFAGQCAAALALVLRQADQVEVRRQIGEAMTSRCRRTGERAQSGTTEHAQAHDGAHQLVAADHPCGYQPGGVRRPT